MPNILNRAIFYKIPVVASNAGGIPEIVTNGRNGLLVLPGDVNGSVEGVKEVLFNKNLRLQFSNYSFPVERCQYIHEVNAYKAFYLKLYTEN